jgi:imidazolonepropionase-like amidohydrolase
LQDSCYHYQVAVTLFPTTGLRSLVKALPGRTIVLVGGSIVDGTGSLPILNGTLVIRDGAITALGPHDEIQIPSSAERIDVGGFWLLPGLVDCHVHLDGEATSDPFRRTLTPSIEARLLRAGRQATALLAAGCTTVRDVGSRHGIDVRRAIEQDLVSGPRVLASGLTITSTGGRWDANHLPSILTTSWESGFAIADGVDECRYQARRALREGADLVSVVISGFRAGETTAVKRAEVTEFSADELTAVVDEAHRRRRRASAHAFGADGLRMAANAGFDTIEHASANPDDSLLDRLLQSRISLVPTLATLRRVADPSAVERGRVLTIAASKLGINVAAGSDTCGSTTTTLAKEIEELVSAGLTPVAAIRAATSGSAIALGLDDRIGSLTKGRLADVLVLTSDPLSDPAVLSHPDEIALLIQAKP